jgi:hypothetical protein
VDVVRCRFEALIFVNNVLADGDALVADEDGRSGDQFPDVILALVAKGASKHITVVFLQTAFLHQAEIRPRDLGSLKCS